MIFHLYGIQINKSIHLYCLSSRPILYSIAQLFLLIMRLLTILPLMTAITFSTGPVTEQNPSDMVLKGWVRVLFSASNVIDENTGKNIDPIVGSIIKAGIPPPRMIWLKPVYGNQNILWFNSSTFSLEKHMRERIQRHELPFGHHGKITPTSAVWYSVTIPLIEDLQLSILACRHSPKSETVVFYWGTDKSQFIEDLINVLITLSKECS